MNKPRASTSGPEQLHSLTLNFINVVLIFGTPNWTQCSRCGLMSSRWRGVVTSLTLFAVFWLIQPRIPLAFITVQACYCLVVDVLSTRTTGPSQVQGFAWFVPRLWVYWLQLPDLVSFVILIRVNSDFFFESCIKILKRTCPRIGAEELHV